MFLSVLFLPSLLILTEAYGVPPPISDTTWDTPETRDDSVVLRTPNVTNWGEWGPFEHCGRNTLVTGFRLKVSDKEDRKDNTALNGIRFSCGYPYHEGHLDEKRIYSYGERFGYPRDPQFCEGYANGIQMKSQKPQGQGKEYDDVAAVNLKLFCDDGKVLEGYEEDEEDQYKDSEYSDKVECPENYGICGLQTQVQRADRRRDNTALNNARIRCCRVPQWVEEHKTTTTTTTTTTTEEPTTTTEAETEGTTENTTEAQEEEKTTTTTKAPVQEEEDKETTTSGTTTTTKAPEEDAGEAVAAPEAVPKYVNNW